MMSEMYLGTRGALIYERCTCIMIDVLRSSEMHLDIRNELGYGICTFIIRDVLVFVIYT